MPHNVDILRIAAAFDSHNVRSLSRWLADRLYPMTGLRDANGNFPVVTKLEFSGVGDALSCSVCLLNKMSIPTIIDVDFESGLWTPSIRRGDSEIHEALQAQRPNEYDDKERRVLVDVLMRLGAAEGGVVTHFQSEQNAGHIVFRFRLNGREVVMGFARGHGIWIRHIGFTAYEDRIPPQALESFHQSIRSTVSMLLFEHNLPTSAVSSGWTSHDTRMLSPF